MTSIALVVLDTLRKDYFDEHFDWLPGTRFENAWSTSHWTVPAHATMFTGRYASEVGVYKNAKLFDYSGQSLVERLREAGYTTRAFSANPNLSEQFEFDRGFEQFEGSWRLERLGQDVFDWDTFIAKNQDAGVGRYFEALWHCIRDDCETIPSIREGIELKLRDLGIGSRYYDDGAREALEFVERTTFGDDEFLFMNLMEAHAPYSAPEEYQSVEPTEIMHLQATLGSPSVDPDEIRQAYDDEIVYLSDVYRDIHSELAENFDIIVTLSDHGEILGEHDAWGHNYGLYPEVTRIPLCIYGDDIPDAPSAPVNLQDVYRTILDAADSDEPTDHGRSLLETDIPETDLLTEYHGLGDRHYHTLQSQGFERVDALDQELDGLISGDYYGYETFFDGFVEHGTAPFENPKDRLRELVDSLEKIDSDSDGEMDEATIQQLKDLGYA